MLLQLTVLLLFCAVVRGMELKCDLICSGNSKTRRFDLCWQCDIKNQQISEPDQVIFVAPQFNNGTIADVERVNLNYGDVSRLPIIIHKTSGKQILLTELSRTNTRALNSQFFGNSGNNLKHFEIFGCDYLIVEAFAFKNCSNLEHLRLIANELTSIPPDAFRGLHKLISLHFSSNRLSLVVKGWFIDLDNLERLSLGGNQLVKIPDDSFESLTNLKELYLTNNKIEIITKNMFQHNEQLQKIGLSDNRINQIQSGTFAHLTQLTDLDVSKNICTNKTFINKTPEQISAALTACQPPTCVIPQIPNGSVISTNDNTTQTPGKSLETFFMVKVVCDPNFIQFHEKEIQTVNMCLKDDWKDEEWPECQRVCSIQEIIHQSISIYCDRKGETISCSDRLRPDTKAIIRCSFGYKMPANVKHVLTCLASGNWDNPAFKCEPICGRVSSHSTALLLQGKNTNVTEVPWHVGIYHYDEQICGGTIVSEKLVITAAHCFSQDINNFHIIFKTTYKVAAGKIRRELDAEETQATQIRDVLDVAIPPMYDGSKTWWADIATVTISGHFEYQPNIAPACLQFKKKFAEKYPQNGTRALVSGWGLAKNFQSSEILQSFDIPVVDFETCLEKVPWDFADKVGVDKICAGYVDRDPNYSKVVCKGDSGGGLLVPQTVNGKKRYYLQGVVSNSAKTMSCDRTFYTLFTNVQHYENFLREGINKADAPKIPFYKKFWNALKNIW